jgi:hypothetical protein
MDEWTIRTFERDDRSIDNSRIHRETTTTTTTTRGASWTIEATAGVCVRAFVGGVRTSRDDDGDGDVGDGDDRDDDADRDGQRHRCAIADRAWIARGKG